MRRSLAMAAVLLFPACGCEAGAAGTARAARGSKPGCTGSSEYPTSPVIMVEELQRAEAPNLYEAIRRVRPNYFETRAPPAIYIQPEAAFAVIVNRQVIGGLAELREMGLAELACVRRLTASAVLLVTGQLAPDGGIELVYGS